MRHIVIACGCALLLHATPATASDASPSLSQLELEKLQEEVEKLRLENDNASGIAGFISVYGGLVTGLAAIAGVVVTYLKQAGDQSRQRTLDREQRDKDLEQRERERLTRREERFSTALAGLGSESASIRVGAATTLVTFISETDHHLLHEVRMAALANLKVDHPHAVKKALVHVLEKAFRLAPLEPFERDLSRADLERIDLSEIDISEGDLAFANLCGANLSGTTLRRAKGYEAGLERARFTRADLSEARFQRATGEGAVFREARLVMSHFKEASLPKAQFQRAELQSSHFDRANLMGAKFEEADLNDTYFRLAVLDEVALRSITRAKNWMKAHFDPETKVRLANIADGG